MKRFYCLIFLMLFFSAQSAAQELKETLIKAFTSQDSSDYYFKIAKRKIKTPADEAQYYFCKNARCCDYNQLDSAVVYGEKALHLLQKVGDIPSLLTVYNNLTKVYRKQGQYDKAIQYSLQGIRVAEKEKKENWIAFFNANLSLTYHDFESYPKGIYYGKKALNYWLSQKKLAPDMICNALNAIAINFDDWNKPDSALYYHKKVFRYFKGKDTIYIGDTYNNIGNTLLKQKKYAEAKRWITSAVKISDKNFEINGGVKDNNYYYERATNYTNLATIAFQTDDFDKAEHYFKIAESYVNKSQNAEKLRDFYFQRSAFNKKRNHLAKAVQDQENYIKIRDSVFDVERAQIFSELEAKYQNEKKEKQLLQSKTEIREREIEIKQKNTQFLILGLVSLALLCIIYLVYRQQKLKIKQKEQEFELKSAITKIETQNRLQEQRLAISRDLHDNIGAQLTFIISSVDNIKYAFDIQNQKLDTKLSGISDFAKSTIIELRDTIWAMNKNEITFEDLQTRIHNFIDKAQEAKSDILFNFFVDDALKHKKFSSIEGMNVYRTIQEAVNNSIKYAEAQKITVEVKSEADKVRISITDDGKGFDVNAPVRGNGLLNIQKRIAEINGSFTIESAPSGTTIRILL
ncbi:tetratricopeptide repeat-containing sensor histidine kinase [Flavobacterium sedimenticola]|uniref:histidine kinase n=1 Tax=Flavobacterium sedimenticola TaxID=3043286 RepID=A0ABT6XR95_9FLAO|nr:tetratricopeptide repeat protein [Flavobacterium sedimenticola]MDI9257520.1 tetratricopeptide repeat protein [Flavobacterium sedimenticola]